MSEEKQGSGDAGLPPLPPPLDQLIGEVLDHAGLGDADRAAAAAVARADLEQHFRDGLERGRSVDELVARFGDPAIAGALLARSPAPEPPTAPAASRSGGPLRDWTHDVRHALRGLTRTPSLAVTAIVVLALGVGANTVVFTVLNELLLRPLPVAEPAGLVDVWADIPGGNSFLGVSYQDYLTYREENTVLDELVAFTGRRVELDRGGEPEVVVGQFLGPGYFEMLGLQPSLGRLSFDEETRFGQAPTAVLTHAFWTEAFGADPAVVGATIRLQDHVVTVQGVGPEGFAGHFIGFPTDLWLPITAADPLLSGWDPSDLAQKDLEMIGRLRPGVTVETARSALNTLAEEIERRNPELNRGHRLGVTATTGLDHSLQPAVRAFVAILGAVSLLVLVIACMNVGSVLLVRAMSRDRELAIRIALGAGRGRLMRQLVTESTVLVTLGAAIGVLVAIRLNALIARTLRAVAGGVGLDLSVDWRVLALTALAALAASVLASVAPALHVFAKDPAGVLRSRGGPSRGSARLRSGLVVGQVAVSVVLVVATGLFVRALVEGSRIDPGFDADAVATFALQLPRDLMPEARAATEREIVQALAALPTIGAVSVATAAPVGVARAPLPVEVPGVLPPPDADRHVVDVRIVGARYLEVVGVPLRSGRDFTEDDRAGEAVAIVSEAFAERFWPGEDPIGRTFTAPDRTGANERQIRVVGVAADARYLIQDDTPDPLVYLARGEDAEPGPVVVTLTSRQASRPTSRPAPQPSSQPASQIGPLPTPTAPSARLDPLPAPTAPSARLDPLRARDAIQRVVDARIAVHPRITLRTARQTLNDALLPQRIGSAIVGAMGLAALFLAGVGLYGLIQFTVARDTHELGVRLALGGGRRDLFLVVLRKGVLLVAIGTAVGIAVALLLAPGLGGFLAGVSPADPVTYLGVIGCFAVVSLLASWLPARRALRIEATEVLRGE